MNTSYQAIIIGGGLSGLTSALHLLKNDFQVLVIEKNSYPKHKVCGEFISNEILPYLDFLNVDLSTLNPTHITKTVVSTQNGKSIEAQLPMGGFGISRYQLDYYLYKEVILRGGVVLQSTVTDIQFEKDYFTIQTSENQYFKTKVALGCFGKRTNLDVQMKRNFIQQKSPWLAVKAHYELPFEKDLVALHNFEGGYCGISMIENGQVNICYLVQYEIFKNFKNIESFQQNIFAKNPHLKNIFDHATLIFNKPLTISQISFENKNQVENHLLMLGDTAGLIHPLCGNGMAMAIHSAKLASELTIDFLHQKIDRKTLEHSYQLQWNHTFKSRLKMGKWLSKVLLNKHLSVFLFYLVYTFPFLMTVIIRKTHGKKIAL